MMTIHEVAKLLDGREYREELTDDEEKRIRESGIIVVFGASDDLVEFRGGIRDEVDAYEKTEVKVKTFPDSRGSQVMPEHDCDCGYCGFKSVWADASIITAEYTPKGWTFQTVIPHAKFTIMEGKQVYGEGLVFAASLIL